MTTNFIFMPPTVSHSGPAAQSPQLIAALLALTCTTGLVDAASLLGLGRVFTANMTGNVVLLGFAIAGTGGFSVGATLTSLLGFLLGAAGAARLGRYAEARQHGWLLPALGVEVSLVLTAAILATALTPTSDSDLRYVAIALLAMAMGARNAAVRGLGVKDLTTTVLTMTLTGLAADSRLAGGTGQGGGRRLAAVGAMLGGAVVGGLLVAYVDLSAPLFLAAAVAALSLTLLAGVSAPRPSPGG
jgi:uncharacterized membrane protein YoaK (UPF0700 family)